MRVKSVPARALSRRAPLAALLGIIAVAAAACASREATPTPVVGAVRALSLSSPAFRDGDRMPLRYTCDGQDLSPPLEWTPAPPETQALVVIMDDPDAPGGVFSHWVLFNLPGESRWLPETVPTEERLPSGALQGKNGFGKVGYGGPCPPPGPTHHYRLVLYALDSKLDLRAGVTREQVTSAMSGHILAQGQLTATYQR